MLGSRRRIYAVRWLLVVVVAFFVLPFLLSAGTWTCFLGNNSLCCSTKTSWKTLSQPLTRCSFTLAYLTSTFGVLPSKRLTMLAESESDWWLSVASLLLACMRRTKGYTGAQQRETASLTSPSFTITTTHQPPPNQYVIVRYWTMEGLHSKEIKKTRFGLHPMTAADHALLTKFYANVRGSVCC